MSGIRRPFHKSTSSLDEIRAAALTHKLESIDIYSNSWGSLDTGWHIGVLGPLTSAALEKGIKKVFYQVIRAFTIE